jgi:hypothetical protein
MGLGREAFFICTEKEVKRRLRYGGECYRHCTAKRDELGKSISQNKQREY